MKTETANYTKLIGHDDQNRACILESPRYRVSFLAAEHNAYKWSAAELLENHPDLTPEQIDAALAYYYDHRREVEREIDEDHQAWVKGRAASKQPSREELLARRKAKS